jgi:alpha-beta hydrolase superfamily lysophospholipase
MQNIYGRRGINMSYTKKDYKVLSSDGVHWLSGVVYIPEGEAKGFFHVAHGMTEYIARYDRIMSGVAEAGYICFGYDHLGHGKTVRDKSELGFIASKNGYDLLCRDIKVFSDAVRAEHDPNFRLPYYLMGHSMGSFIVRLATEKYARPDKLIVMGTGGANPAAPLGIALISLIKLFKGEKHISKFVYSLAFGSYNNKFKNDADASSSSWLTTDQSIRQKYSSDEYCTFKFTVSAMGDLMRLLKNCNRGAWFKNMPRIPILLVAGEDDPVGNYGKGVREVEKKLIKRGHDVKCILYKGARHEILNDFTYDEVKKDILNFLE